MVAQITESKTLIKLFVIECDILVRSDDAETIKYSGTLSQSQVEHIVFLIQDNYSAKDIKDQIIEYEVQNLSPTVTPQIGDPEFLEE